jgi:hypothetical protein
MAEQRGEHDRGHGKFFDINGVAGLLCTTTETAATLCEEWGVLFDECGHVALDDLMRALGDPATMTHRPVSEDPIRCAAFEEALARAFA